MAEILRIDVDTPLALATSAAHEVRGRVVSADARAALDIATQEMRCAAEDIANLVGGIAPRSLGSGRLRQALEELAVRSPVPVTVTVGAGADGDQDAETTLFYVCSEALVNVVKHAAAEQVSIAIDSSGDDLVMVVSDDGCGGADPAGFGLQGLADRLAARRGRLRVESPPGAGTVLTATTPR